MGERSNDVVEVDGPIDRKRSNEIEDSEDSDEIEEIEVIDEIEETTEQQINNDEDEIIKGYLFNF